MTKKSISQIEAITGKPYNEAPIGPFIDDDEDYTPELGDVVTFQAWGEYGEVNGDGEITRVYKNGQIKVEMSGKTYKTNKYNLLSRGG